MVALGMLYVSLHQVSGVPHVAKATRITLCHGALPRYSFSADAHVIQWHLHTRAESHGPQTNQRVALSITVQHHSVPSAGNIPRM